MTDINNDTLLLSAYIDGELSPEESLALETRLAEEPELEKQLTKMQANDQELRSALSSLDNEPMPENIRRLLDGDTELLNQLDEEYQTKSSSQENLKQGTLGWLSLHKFSWPNSIAAGFLLACGLWLSQQFITQPVSEPLISQTGAITPRLNTLLNTIVSGENAQIENHQFTPALSFTQQNGDLCRQYTIETVTSDGIQQLNAVACKAQEQWSNMASQETQLASESNYARDDDLNYQPAGTDPQNTVEHYILDNIDGIPLTLEEEKVALAQ